MSPTVSRFQKQAGWRVSVNMFEPERLYPAVQQ